MCILQHNLIRVETYMESKQRLIIVVERLQELQVDLDLIHQEQATLVNELVQLTSAVPDHTPSVPTGYSVGLQATTNIGYKEEDTASTTSQPLCTQSITTPVKNMQTQQLQVGDHIYIKNKISHSDRPNAKDRAGVITDIAHYPKQQVFLTTYSGVETSCSPLNLRRLSLEEKTRLRKQQDE